MVMLFSQNSVQLTLSLGSRSKEDGNGMNEDKEKMTLMTNTSHVIWLCWSLFSFTQLCIEIVWLAKANLLQYTSYFSAYLANTFHGY